MYHHEASRARERGVSTVEYAFLLAGLLVFAMASIEAVGSAVSDGLEDARDAIETGEAPATLAFVDGDGESG